MLLSYVAITMAQGAFAAFNMNRYVYTGKLIHLIMVILTIALAFYLCFLPL